MKGIYKTDKSLYLYEYIAYKDISWKTLLKKKNLIPPRLSFHRKGILVLYNLDGCVIEDEDLIYKGSVVTPLKLSK